MIPLVAYSDFKSASTEVLSYLHSQLGFRLWMVTRTESDDWIVLSSDDHGYDVNTGDIFRWTDSFCSRMVQGLGPRIAPNSDQVPSYASAPIGQQVDIGAYIGVPLTRSNGDLFGTLCAIDPQPMPVEIESELPMIELVARLLTTILEFELKAEDERRKAERASSEAVTDPLTQLYNRRGWDKILAAENLRCQRYSHPTCLLSIDLDDLKKINDEEGHAQGDDLLCRAAKALNSAVRETDVVARIGGDEFAVLGVECEPAGANALLQRLEKSLANNNVSASIGMAIWNRKGSLIDTFESADQKMYECKRQSKSER